MSFILDKIFKPSSPKFFLGPAIRFLWKIYEGTDQHYKGVSLKKLISAQKKKY